MLLRKRNSFFLLLILLSTDIYGQQNLLEQRISIQFTNDPVSEALDKLSKAANCDFFYRPSDLPLNRNITRTFNNELVDVIIKSVWGTDQLILRAGSNDISIKPKREPKKTSEKGSLQGVITDEKGKPVPFATVAIIGTGKGVIADEEGKFQINQLPEGDYQLSISSSGFKVKDLAVEVIADQTVTLRIEMIFATNELDEVVIFGKTDSQLKMEQPIKVEVINTEKLQTKSISLPQVINQTSGINVRQTGAIGRPAIININGLQGNAIRYFKDDIPMDYLGRAFDITLLPVDQLDNIEIYKGVLPAELGADALGGALNFTTRQNSNNNLDLAYTIGSFNTHQVNINGYYDIPKTKLFTSLASYYVYSDNNYKVKVEIPNPVTANLEETEVERFHDGIETYFAEGKVGLRDFKYGDLLVFGYARFDWEKERQNGIQLDPNSALGEVMDLETSDIFSLRYKLTKGKFHLDAFGAYSNRNTIFEDNPEFRYNWLGEQLPLINQGGETSFTSKFYRELNF
ncbi:MAG: TonB-dependent receptor, partial [Bacteroidota bacterium]